MAPVDLVQVRIAVLSVADDRGLLALATALDRLGVTLGCTERTYSTLYTQGLETELLSRYVRPLIDGRLQTLYPELHAPLAARDDERDALAAAALEPIDLVVCNPVPFERAVERADVTDALAADAIDADSVTLIRAAARACARVAVLVDPDDYPAVLDELARTGGALGAVTRLRLAARAFAVTAAHDAAVASWLGDRLHSSRAAAGDDEDDGGAIVRPRHGALVTGPWRRAALPVSEVELDGHPPAALYALAPSAAAADDVPTVLAARRVAGTSRALSGEVVADLDRALALACELDASLSPLPDRLGAAAVVVRGGEPLSASAHGHPLPAIGHVLGFADDEEALEDGRPGVTGGALAIDVPLTLPLVRLLARSRLAAIVVPAMADDALAAWPADGPTVLVADGTWHGDPWRGGALAPLAWRSVVGGLLVQEQDVAPLEVHLAVMVSARSPTDEERRDLTLAARVARHVRAHALVIARHASTLAISGGAPDVRRAVLSAHVMSEELLHGAVAALSAPIDDPLDLDALAAAGLTALWQPGGSPEDTRVIAAADRRGLAMVMTGVPHLRR